jgi:hypothetical protein
MSYLAKDMQNAIQENADLIHLVIMAVYDPQLMPQLESVLVQAEGNGWTSLVAAIRKVTTGQRDIEEFRSLDEEDRTIIEAILKSIDDPILLPELTNAANPAMAGPMIARLVYAAGKGDGASRSELSAMVGKMAECGGDLSRIAAIMDVLVEGERDPETLYAVMDGPGMTLIDEILKELNRLER